MTKYQEAFKRVFEDDTYGSADEHYLKDGYILFSDNALFDELVGKETPKKVKIRNWTDVVVGQVTEFYCPRCNKAVDLLSEKHPNFYKHPYCPQCGQKLDWSKE